MKLEPVNYALFELTNYCNLACSFCNRSELMGKGKRYPLKHMDIITWKRILKKFSKHPLQEVKFTGLGEPFLHRKFDILLEMFKQQFPNCKTIVATNCQYRINDSFKNSLNFIDVLYLSIDGYEKSYERDRAPAKWRKLIAFLDDLKNVDRKSCEIVVNYVVNKDNIQDIEKIKKLAKDYDLGELRLNIAQEWDEEKEMGSGYSKDDINLLKSKHGNLIKGVSAWTWSDCFWPTRGIYVNVTGDILMCALNTSTEPFGNVLHKEVDEIRNGIRWQKIAKNCITDKPGDHCKNCSYKEMSPLLEKLGINNGRNKNK